MTERGRALALLVNIGSPAAPTPAAVRRFLNCFLSDRRVVPLPRLLWLPLLYGVITPVRSPRVARNYRQIWFDDGAPLTVYMQRLADKVDALLPADVDCRSAMCYADPLLDDVLAPYENALDRLVVIPMYPQYAGSTSAAVFDAVAAVLADWQTLPSVQFVSHYYDQPSYIDAITTQIITACGQPVSPECVLLSYHGIPQSMADNGDRYPDDCVATTNLIRWHLNNNPHTAQVRVEMAFQSQFGKAKWLTPSTLDMLDRLFDEGVRSVAICCPGFAVDCLETLEEIAGEACDHFQSRGDNATCCYLPALNDGEAHVQLITRLVQTPCLNGCGAA